MARRLFSMVPTENHDTPTNQTPMQDLTNLTNFITMAVSYVGNPGDEHALFRLNASLKLISLRKNATYSDEQECEKYFNVLLKLLKSDFPDMWTIYRALKAASLDDTGIQNMKTNFNLLEYLFAYIPKVENYEDYRKQVDKKESTHIMDVLSILQQVTRDLTYPCVNMSFTKILENLASIFIALCESEQKIACSALICIRNLCRANYERLSWVEMQMMGGNQFLKNLLLFKTTSKLENLTADIILNDEMPANTPLLVIHLMLLLEKTTEVIPPGQLSRQIALSYDALLCAIQCKHTPLILQATEYLCDFLRMRHHNDIVYTIVEYPRKFEEILDSLLESKNAESSSNLAIINLLSDMLSIKRANEKNLPIKKTMVLCYSILLRFTNSLKSGEVGLSAIKLIEKVTSFTADVLEHQLEDDDDAHECTKELHDILTLCGLILESAIDLEQHELTDEDCDCLESTLRLIICICKSTDMRNSVQEILAAEIMDNLHTNFVVQKPGRISNVIVSYLMLLADIEEWKSNFDLLVQNPEICKCVAFVLKHGSANATLQAVRVTNLMNKESFNLVKESLELLPYWPVTNGVMVKKPDHILSQIDSAMVDEMLTNFQHNNDTRKVEDYNFSTLIALLEGYKLQVNNQQRQLALLQENLNAANSLATHTMQLYNSAQEKQADLATKAVNAERSCFDLLEKAQSANKKRKITEDTALTMKEHIDTLFSRLQQKEDDFKALQVVVEGQKRELSAAEKEIAEFKKTISELEAKEKALEEKMASYKKDCTTFKHKNGVLLKELDIIRAEKQAVSQEKNEAVKQLEELKRIQDMIAGLTGGKNN